MEKVKQEQEEYILYGLSPDTKEPLFPSSDHQIQLQTPSYPTSVASNSPRIQSFHVGCPLTMKWICFCKDYDKLLHHSAIDTEQWSNLLQLQLIQQEKKQIEQDLYRHYQQNNMLETISKPIFDIDVELLRWRNACFRQRDQIFRELESPRELAPKTSSISTYAYVPKTCIGSTPPMFKPHTMQDPVPSQLPRIRLWPPSEFEVFQPRKVAEKKGRKKKQLHPMISKPFTFSKAKTCVHCKTQKSPLWRKGWPKGANVSSPQVKPIATESAALSASSSQTSISTTGVLDGVTNPAPATSLANPVPVEVDLCHQCHIRWKKGLIIPGKKTLAKVPKKKKKRKHDKEYIQLKKEKKRRKKELLQAQLQQEQHQEQAYEQEKPQEQSKKIETIKISKAHFTATPATPIQEVKAEPLPVVPEASAPVVPVVQKTISPAREKELRQAKQYCPVCNQVYEDDDVNSFICCDSCQMWIHTLCDPSLTKERLDSLSTSAESYICPLCRSK